MQVFDHLYLLEGPAASGERIYQVLEKHQSCVEVGPLL
jgi:hypothetical protein